MEVWAWKVDFWQVFLRIHINLEEGYSLSQTQYSCDLSDFGLNFRQEASPSRSHL